MSGCWICQIQLSYFKSYQSRSIVQKTSFQLDPQKKFHFLITDLYLRATCGGTSPWSGCLRWHQQWRWRRLRQQKGRCGCCPAPDKMTPPCHCWRKIKKTLQRGKWKIAMFDVYNSTSSSSKGSHWNHNVFLHKIPFSAYFRLWQGQCGALHLNHENVH